MMMLTKKITKPAPIRHKAIKTCNDLHRDHIGWTALPTASEILRPVLWIEVAILRNFVASGIVE
jgi:hypothetical protein